MRDTEPFHGISGTSIEFLGERVRKRARGDASERLRRQAQHMRRLHDKAGDVILGPLEINDDGYVMEYYPGVTLDVYCTMCPQQVAFHRLREIVGTLWNRLYSKHTDVFDCRAYCDYLRGRLDSYGRLGENVSSLQDLLARLVDSLTGDGPLENCAAGLVHGDLTFENILVTADSFVLIDGNPQPGGAVPWTLDIGKLRQSVFSRYEMIKYSGSKSRLGLESTYEYLAGRFARLFVEWDEEADLQARFFEVSHYIRLLDYQHRRDAEVSRDYYRRAEAGLDDLVTSLRIIGQ